jgi:hypothetical protein
MPVQSEQSLAALTEAVDADRHRTPVWPEHLVALVGHIAVPAVALRVVAKENDEGAWHTRGIQMGASGVLFSGLTLEDAHLAEL